MENAPMKYSFKETLAHINRYFVPSEFLIDVIADYGSLLSKLDNSLSKKQSVIFHLFLETLNKLNEHERFEYYCFGAKDALQGKYKLTT